MIKNNQKRLNRIHVLLDGLVTMLSYYIAWAFLFRIQDNQSALTFWHYMAALLFIVPVYLFLYGIFGLYLSKRVSGRRAELANIIKANVLGFLLITLFSLLDQKIYTCLTSPEVC